MTDYGEEIRKGGADSADPIDAMSDEDVIAEVERVSGYKWGFGRAKAVSYLSPHSSVDGAYAVAFTSGCWSLWGGEGRFVRVGYGRCEGGVDAAKIRASRDLLKHWRDNPSDAPKPTANAVTEVVSAAYQALHDAGISEPESLADGIRALTARADGLFDQLGEVKRALTDAGILDFDSAVDGVRKLLDRESTKRRLAERWHLEWVKHDEDVVAVSGALSTLIEFMKKHGRE